MDYSFENENSNYRHVTKKKYGNITDDIFTNKKREQNRNNRVSSRLFEDSNLNYNAGMHSSNIDRRVMERGGMFNSRSDDADWKRERDNNIGAMMVNDNTFNSDNSESRGVQFNDPYSDVGEITGQKLSISDMEQGMPARSFMDNMREDPRDRIEDVDHQRQAYNPNLDFDLFDSAPQNNVSYYDPLSNNIDSNFSNIQNSDQLLTSLERDSISPSSVMSATINMFSWDLLNRYNHLLKGKQSLIISPYTVLLPLMILYRGSSGNTEEEFKKILSFPDKKNFPSFAKMTEAISRSPSILFSNCVYIPNHFPISNRFVEYVRGVSEIDLLDLSRPLQQVQKINYRVSQGTKNMIRGILDPTSINQNTVMVLVSTVYFYSTWKHTFYKRLTKQDYFYSGTNNRRVVQMMHQKDKTHNYFEDNNNQIIELDYADNCCSFGIILPKQQLNGLPYEQYLYYVTKLAPTKINNLKIPKFSQQSKIKVDSMLKKMGMRDLFTDADLSEMSNSSEGLYVSDILHKAVIIINEEGTEASGATAAVLANSYGYNPNKRSIDFVANHQFMYYIRHKKTNTVLFVGTYN